MSSVTFAFLHESMISYKSIKSKRLSLKENQTAVFHRSGVWGISDFTIENSMRRADQKTIVFPEDYSCKVCGALLFSVKKFSREYHSNRLFQER